MTGALAADLICWTLPARKAVRNSVEIVARRSRYHTNFVWSCYDKSTLTSYLAHPFLPAPTVQ